MAKSIIINELGTKKVSMYLPADAASAQAFADTVLEGTYTVLEQKSSLGTDVANTGRYVNVMIQNDTTLEKRYYKFIIKSSKHEGDVISAMLNKTFDGIFVDKVVVIGMQSAEF